MLKILVPVDGAATAQQAVEQVAKLYRNEANCEIHLLDVQRPIESGHTRMLVSHGDIEAYQRKEGRNARANVLKHSATPVTVVKPLDA